MEIRSFAGVEFSAIFHAFSQAFAGYEVQLNAEQLHKMLQRRGFNPQISFAAFKDDAIVSFTLSGRGTFNGTPTAYDTGTGTLEAYRGKGLATDIFTFSIPFLQEQGIRQYLLEVLQHNTGAVSVYKKLGFAVTREFNYFICKKDEVLFPSVKARTECQVREVDIERVEGHDDFWDFYPSWQNSFEAIRRSPEDFTALGAFSEEKLVGYCVCEPASGDITQLAVAKDSRRKGIGSYLLKEAVSRTRFDTVKVINTDVQCTSITGFLQCCNIPLKGKQFEMVKKIND